MKKYVFIMDALELQAQLAMGKRIQGVLFVDKTTGVLTYKPYKRKPYMRERDRLVCHLEHGWVKESVERIKVYESVPKVLGAAGVGHVLQREAKRATETLLDCELDEMMFC